MSVNSISWIAPIIFGISFGHVSSVTFQTARSSTQPLGPDWNPFSRSSIPVTVGGDTETGRSASAFEVGVKLTAPSVRVDVIVFIGASKQIVYVIEPKTGEIYWEFRTLGKVVALPEKRNGDAQTSRLVYHRGLID